MLCKSYSKLGLKNYSKQCLTYELNQNATALTQTQLLKYGTQEYLYGNSFKLTCNTFTKHVLPWQPNKQFILHFITFYIISIHASITESNWKSAESLLFTLCFSHIKNRFILIKSF